MAKRPTVEVDEEYLKEVMAGVPRRQTYISSHLYEKILHFLPGHSRGIEYYRIY